MDLSFYITSLKATHSNYPNQIMIHEITGFEDHAAQVAIYTAIGYGVDNSGTQSNYIINGTTQSTSLNVYNWITSRCTFDTTSTMIAAISNAYINGIKYVICSDSGLTGSFAKYPFVQMVMPLGSNNHIQLTLTPDVIPNVITTGYGLTANQTAYGNGIEFFDSSGGASSFSNGIIGGKIIYIQETLGCDIWEARYRARMSASNNGAWNINDGYGIISVTAAIGYTGSIITNPYPII